MKHTRILAALLGVATLLTTSCGVGDKIGSVSVSAVGITGAGVINLAGLGGTIQLHVTANYTSGKQIDETNFVTYVVTPEFTDDTNTLLPSPPQTLTIDKTGMVTAVEPAVCTWKNNGTLQSPSWFITGDYKIVATYRGFTSQPIFIPVASAANNQNNTNGQCGPVA